MTFAVILLLVGAAYAGRLYERWRIERLLARHVPAPIVPPSMELEAFAANIDRWNQAVVTIPLSRWTPVGFPETRQ